MRVIFVIASWWRARRLRILEERTRWAAAVYNGYKMRLEDERWRQDISRGSE